MSISIINGDTHLVKEVDDDAAGVNGHPGGVRLALDGPLP
jgi:hypothetical protein